MGADDGGVGGWDGFSEGGSTQQGFWGGGGGRGWNGRPPDFFVFSLVVFLVCLVVCQEKKGSGKESKRLLCKWMVWWRMQRGAGMAEKKMVEGLVVALFGFWCVLFKGSS